MNNFDRELSSLARKIHADTNDARISVSEIAKSEIEPPSKTLPEEVYQQENSSPASQLVYFSLVEGTEEYIENLVNQINGCYQKEWYDACAVMLRRLIEILIIETFEAHEIIDEIKTKKGYYRRLHDLIEEVTTAEKWNVDPRAAKSLSELKDLGNVAAHGRRQIVIREDIEQVRQDVRNVAQELVGIVKSTGRWR